MSEYLLLLIGTVFVNNIVLVKFLGLCPFMGVSRKVETAIGMSAATTFVLTLSAVLSYLINSWILAPLELEYLRTIASSSPLRRWSISPKWWCIKPARCCTTCSVSFCP